MAVIETNGAAEGGSPGEGSAAVSTPVVENPSKAAAPIRSGRCWGLAMLVAVIAGVGAWLGGEAIYGRFMPPLMATSGFPSIEEVQANTRARQSGTTLEATLTTALLGGLLGLGLGVVGGVVRGSGRSAGIAGLSGLVLGAGAGALATQALMPVYFQFYNPDQDDLIVAILIQGAIAAAMGAGVGAALGVGIAGGWGEARTRDGRGVVVRSLVGGLFGAVLGILVYQIVGVMAFPLDQTSKPLSTSSGSRMLALVAVAVLVALGAVKGALQPPSPSPVAKRASG
ncbi:hypothetical protein [Tautonia marina]|uniref:hypothetical protein n=1 Tax=Tautonia marina TaxID=2653855 RepID=UPI001260A77F|nr:hypothetical protein [Tautonia marina]